jgi:hypothetical protein
METRTGIRKHARISGAAKLLKVDYSIKPRLFHLDVIEHPNRNDIALINTKKIIRMHVLPEKGRKYLNCANILKRLKAANRVILDARVMEEFIKKPNFIPKTWKEINKPVYFLGTIFEERGYKYVVFLYFTGEYFLSGYISLANKVFSGDDLFAVHPND